MLASVKRGLRLGFPFLFSCAASFMSRLTATSVVLLLLSSLPVSGDILDFNDWTTVQDPPHAGLSASADSATQVTLSAASQPIPHATDIGFQSISGVSPATSGAGFAFDSANSFSVGVDFALTLNSAVGGLGLGFGIGEDSNGSNSAGVVLLTSSGVALPFGAAARINDTNQPPQAIPILSSLTGRFIAAYDATSGDVQLGVSTNGDNVPEGTATFSGIQNSWVGGQLFPSLFLRSDDTLGTAWTSGTADAVFTNFQVTSGTPVSVPEPSGMGLVVILGMLCLHRCGRRRATRA